MIDRKIILGIDIGSITAKAVIVDSGKLLSWVVLPAGSDIRSAARLAADQAISKAGIKKEDIVYTAATGYGAANAEAADETVSDITAHGLGAHYFFPAVRTVVDIGGQFSRAFRLDDSGHVVSFVMSEKCAAGSGRLLQVIARVLRVNVEDLGPLALKSTRKVDFTTGCAVFNESEAISRIAEGETREDIAAGVARSLAAKVQSMVERVGLQPDLALTGGGAKNAGLVKAVEEKLGQKVLVAEEPRITAALGAALTAAAKSKM
jgi:predicted CoA-substrate-specific enzyme activase